MSFLKFLSKKKPKFDFPNKVDLDVPPAPPGQDIPSFPAPPEPMGFETEEPMDMAPEMPEAMPPQMPMQPEPKAEEIESFPLEEELPDYNEVVPRKVTDEPLFVEVQHYKALMDDLNSIKNRIKESEDTLQKITDLKEDQEMEFVKWHSYLEDIQKKLIFVDKTLFRG